MNSEDVAFNFSNDFSNFKKRKTKKKKKRKEKQPK